jgi:hypothetical protein
VSAESRAYLSRIGAEYEDQAGSARQIFEDAARAEARYRKEKAKAALRFKESGEKMSVAEADLRADADDAVSGLYEDRLVKQAAADSLKEVLKALKERAANGRTFIIDERAGDEMHARGGGTP